MSNANYHQYIYDIEKRKIIGDFEGAYANCEDVWPTQHALESPHFSYIRGLLAKKRIDLNRPLKVLDIGCGYGDFVNDLEKYGIGEITGFDVSESAINKGKQRFGSQLDIRVGNLLYGLNVNKHQWDCVLLLGVFWFLLENTEKCLKKIEEFLIENGIAIFTLHVPKDPIGNEIIANYQDFIKIIKTRFSIEDVFFWHHDVEQSTTLDPNVTMTDIIIRCRAGKN